MTDVTWDRPAPGTWEWDAAHSTRPPGRCFSNLYEREFSQGFAEGFEHVGAPLDTIDHAVINGWPYISIRPLGGPPEPKGPPPRLLMSVMFALVPSLRARKRRAATLFTERPWRARWDEWERHGEPSLSARVNELRDTGPSSRDDHELVELLEELEELTRAVIVNHFRNSPMTAVTVGDFFVHCERWAGVSASEAMNALTGFAEATQRPLMHFERIVDALRKDDALGVLDGASEGLAARIADASPAASQHLHTYLQDYGLHMVTGITVFDLTLEECPEIWHASLRARAARTEPRDAAVTTIRVGSERAADALRERVPAERRAEWDEMLIDARRGLAVRESDVHLLGKIVGLLRSTMLDVGRRLVSRGLADDPSSALDLELHEAREALLGRGLSGAQIRAFTAERKRHEKLQPPAVLGPPPAPPPTDRFPAPVARVTEASYAFVSRFKADADPIEREGLAGHGVSPGVVEGVARVLDGPEDFDRFNDGDILVARTTSPTFNVVLAMASGVVTEVGGIICHAAIVAREFGMPGIVGVKGLMDAIPDGARVRIDGGAGTIEVLEADAHVPPRASRSHEDDDLPEPRVPDEPGELVALRDAHPKRFGGKASQLARLLGEGVAVPDGIALDPDFSEAVAAGDEAHRQRLFDALAQHEGAWAVRSSCLAEDGKDASFAGQFLTVLGVTDPSRCADAVTRVWRSAHGAGVRAYRKRLGLDGRARMAVVVQRLVDAEVAGILFSDEEGRHLVEASWGLGEPVVSGAVDPDRYTLSSDGMALNREIADKPTELRRDPSGETVTRVVPETRRRMSCLDDRALADLARLAERCRAIFGEPRDIEWAFDRAGRLLCLQSRPITRAMPAAEGQTLGA